MIPHYLAADIAMRHGTQIFLPGDELDIDLQKDSADMTAKDREIAILRSFADDELVKAVVRDWELLEWRAASDAELLRLLRGIDEALALLPGRRRPARFVLQEGYLPVISEAGYNRETDSVVITPTGLTAMPELHQRALDIFRQHVGMEQAEKLVSHFQAPTQVVLHEMAHALDGHLDDRDDILAQLIHWTWMNRSQLPQGVFTSQAYQSPTEFVAEVFATEVLTPGTLPAPVLEHYQALQGPALSSVPAVLAAA